MKKVHNCVGVSVDIISVNLGKRDSILTRVLEKTPTIFRVALATLCITHV